MKAVHTGVLALGQSIYTVTCPAEGVEEGKMDLPLHLPSVDGSLQSHRFGVAITVDTQGM